MIDDISGWDIAFRFSASAICGAVVGWERGRHDKPAGLRTHILVCTGSTAIVLTVLRFLSIAAKHAAEDPTAPVNILQLDPFRVVQGVLAGVGLIAGGSIIRHGGSVHGLTTAGSIWAITAVGLACGFGDFDIAVSLTILTITVTGLLVWLDPKEHDHEPGTSG